MPQGSPRDRLCCISDVVEQPDIVLTARGGHNSSSEIVHHWQTLNVESIINLCQMMIAL
jgi:hypothetical protein